MHAARASFVRILTRPGPGRLGVMTRSDHRANQPRQLAAAEGEQRDDQDDGELATGDRPEHARLPANRSFQAERTAAPRPADGDASTAGPASARPSEPKSRPATLHAA